MGSKRREPIEQKVANAFCLTVDTRQLPQDMCIVGDIDRHLQKQLTRQGISASEWCRWSVGTVPGKAWPSVHSASGATLRIPKEKDAFDLYVHGIASVLPSGASLWVYGANDEGIRSAGKRLSPLFENIVTMGTKRHCRVWHATRTQVEPKHALEAWIQDRTIDFGGGPKKWMALPGVFARGGLDPASALLISQIETLNIHGRVLDFCCGTGVLGAAILGLKPDVDLELSDADSVAVKACQLNVPNRPCHNSDGFHSISSEKFDWIMSNPPIHRGREEDHRILDAIIHQGQEFLRPGGQILIVVQKRVNLGQRLTGHYDRVACLADDGRFQVWLAQ